MPINGAPSTHILKPDNPLYDCVGTRVGEIEYEDFLQEGDPDADWALPGNEWDPISLSYTSGTTGDPKGVVTNHRGASEFSIADRDMEHAAAPRLFVDTADVPLQRLVLPLGYRGQRRREHLLAQD